MGYQQHVQECVSLVHRYYDPTTGQFLSVDPLVDATGTPYAYTGGDPVNGSDPSGLCDVTSGDPNHPFVHTHNGACTASEASLIESQACAIRSGTSIYAGESPAAGTFVKQFEPLQGLEGAANFIEGFGNSELQGYEFFVHYGTLGLISPTISINPVFNSNNPYANWDYTYGGAAGTAYGVAQYLMPEKILAHSINLSVAIKAVKWLGLRGLRVAFGF